MAVTDADYQRLLAFRTNLRRFERWSRERAAEAGLTTVQHQLMLGHPDERGPTVTHVAEYLCVRHHSAVELVDRAQHGGLVVRTPDMDDQRVVRLALTPQGRRSLEALSLVHLEELARLGPALCPLWEGPAMG
jgi:DNA-binding MarR family transcriptional regulator